MFEKIWTIFKHYTWLSIYMAITGHAGWSTAAAVTTAIWAGLYLWIGVMSLLGRLPSQVKAKV